MHFLLDIGVNDVPVACITDIGFYSAARFRMNDLEYNVSSWPEIRGISLPDACESSFVTFVYRCYSQTVYTIRDNPIRKIFFTIVVKPLDYRVPVNWNGAENCFVLANIKCLLNLWTSNGLWRLSCHWHQGVQWFLGGSWRLGVQWLLGGLWCLSGHWRLVVSGSWVVCGVWVVAVVCVASGSWGFCGAWVMSNGRAVCGGSMLPSTWVDSGALELWEAWKVHGKTD